MTRDLTAYVYQVLYYWFCGNTKSEPETDYDQVLCPSLTLLGLYYILLIV